MPHRRAYSVSLVSRIGGCGNADANKRELAYTLFLGGITVAKKKRAARKVKRKVKRKLKKVKRKVRKVKRKARKAARKTKGAM